MVRCHNVGEVAELCIQSLRDLDYYRGKLKFALINDGSTDHATQLLDGLKDDESVQVIHHEQNRGGRLTWLGHYLFNKGRGARQVGEGVRILFTTGDMTCLVAPKEDLSP